MLKPLKHCAILGLFRLGGFDDLTVDNHLS